MVTRSDPTKGLLPGGSEYGQMTRQGYLAVGCLSMSPMLVHLVPTGRKVLIFWMGEGSANGKELPFQNDFESWLDFLDVVL